jgi:hypothetical protein
MDAKLVIIPEGRHGHHRVARIMRPNSWCNQVGVIVDEINLRLFVMGTEKSVMGLDRTWPKNRRKMPWEF